MFGGEVKYTKRYQLGQRLGARTRHLLLMTATPHNGKEAGFPALHGAARRRSVRRQVPRRRAQGRCLRLMRRLTKEELYKFDGTPLFPDRLAYTVRYELSDAEAALYAAVTHYVRDGDEPRRSDAGGRRAPAECRLCAADPAAPPRVFAGRHPESSSAAWSGWKPARRTSASARTRPAPACARATVDAKLLDDAEDFDDAPEEEVEAIEEDVRSTTPRQRRPSLNWKRKSPPWNALEAQAAPRPRIRHRHQMAAAGDILDDPLVTEPARATGAS